MTSRGRALVRWLFVALAVPACPALPRSAAQEVPLYRDPSPTEGPRIEGPLLSRRAPSAVAPVLAPPPDHDAFPAVPVLMSEVAREPLLGVPPILPPLPAMVLPPLQPAGIPEFRRTTKIRGPKGVIGRAHDWFRDTIFGPPGPPSRPAATAATTEPPARFFSFNWPTWPGSIGR